MILAILSECMIETDPLQQIVKRYYLFSLWVLWMENIGFFPSFLYEMLRDIAYLSFKALACIDDCSTCCKDVCGMTILIMNFLNLRNRNWMF